VAYDGAADVGATEPSINAARDHRSPSMAEIVVHGGRRAPAADLW
jgi:hypothetical protein